MNLKRIEVLPKRVQESMTRLNGKDHDSEADASIMPKGPAGLVTHGDIH